MSEKKPQSTEHVGKVALIILGLIVAAVVYSAIVDSRSPKSAASGSTGSARISVIHAQSFCQVDVGASTITYVVALRNRGAATGTTSLRPWRRYSDGSVNDGSGDVTDDFKVEADSIRNVNTTVPYDLPHIPKACRVYLKDSGSSYFAIPIEA